MDNIHSHCDPLSILQNRRGVHGMTRLKIMAENILMLMSFNSLLTHIVNYGDVARIIIASICCLIVLIASVKDN